LIVFDRIQERIAQRAAHKAYMWECERREHEEQLELADAERKELADFAQRAWLRRNPEVTLNDYLRFARFLNEMPTYLIATTLRGLLDPDAPDEYKFRP
jgi:hypothetical protein